MIYVITLIGWRILTKRGKGEHTRAQDIHQAGRGY